MGRKALMIVDVQEDTVKLPWMAGVLEATAEALVAARREGWLVVHLTDWHRPDDPEVLRVGERCMAESPGAAIPERIAPVDGEAVIRKRESSGFSNPSLLETLRREGVEEVFLAGDLCVYPNAKDLMARKFKVKAIEDAIGAPYQVELLKRELGVFDVPLVPDSQLPGG
ncbi:MAG: isochorismatase family cysteine hydrolase [Dehalococcoidia bacterium]|nr:isochorismatase family cysteine hydrolase [Dehalococcoidia bacterium]